MIVEVRSFVAAQAGDAPLHALDDVDGTTVAWPLGAALAAASMGIPL